MLIAGARVRVHRNLHRGGYSVLSWEPGPRKGRVIAHVDAIDLGECLLIVQPGGRARTLARGRRTVHAYVEGLVLGDLGPAVGERLRYDPRIHEGFNVDGAVIDRAAHVRLDTTGAYLVRRAA